MTPEYILRKSLCREPHCASGDHWRKTAESCIDNLGYASQYAEPGYTDPSKGILFSNWNYFPKDIGDILERYGFEIEWEDEWATCDNCGKAVRTSPDSYGWQPSYLFNECQIICKDCIGEGDFESLENDPERALNVHGIDPSCFGYRKLEDGFESGFHPGQNDNPKTILARLSATHDRLLFVVDGVGQFDLGFSVWEKIPESD